MSKEHPAEQGLSTPVKKNDLFKETAYLLTSAPSHRAIDSSPLKESLLERKFCNCRKSRCLKFYCQCFSKGELCETGCRCEDCFNSIEKANSPQRIHAIEQIHYKDKDAFSKRINKIEASSERGCNCRKSSCLKNYCECYLNNMRCGVGCNCDDCKNEGVDYYSKPRRMKPVIEKIQPMLRKIQKEI